MDNFREGAKTSMFGNVINEYDFIYLLIMLGKKLFNIFLLDKNNSAFA